MKYNHNCVCCKKLATKRYRSKWFCDECFRYTKRTKKDKVYHEKLVYTFLDDSSVHIYKIEEVKLK